MGSIWLWLIWGTVAGEVACALALVLGEVCIEVRHRRECARRGVR